MDDLGEHVESLRRELGRLTGAFVDDNFNSMNTLMVGLERMKGE